LATSFALVYLLAIVPQRKRTGGHGHSMMVAFAFSVLIGVLAGIFRR